MSTPTLTIVEHVQIPSGSRLVVRVPETAAAVFAGIAGTAIDEIQIVPVEGDEDGATHIVPTGDAIVSVEWGADVAPGVQLAETRGLIEHALSVAASPAPDPEPITPPGTEL